MSFLTEKDRRRKQEKQGKVSDIKLIATYNQALLKISKIIQNNLSYVHTDEDMNKFFPLVSLITLHREENNLKEILSSSIFSNKFSKNESSISSCNKCDICKNYLISDNKFKCKVLDRVYSVRISFSCKSTLMLFI